MRVKLPTGLYASPDVSVVCSAPRLEGDRQDVLLNPLVIMEVLSPSTEAHDRGTKFKHDGRLPSLREDVPGAQDRVNVERFSRISEEGNWVFTRSAGTDATTRFAAIERTLALSDIYTKVELDSKAAAPPPPLNGETRPG